MEALRPTVLREAAAGSGKACGSIFLNRIFADYLKDRFGETPRWDDEVLREAMKRFDAEIKRKFHEDRLDQYFIPVNPLADDPAEGIRRGRLRLTKDIIKTIFEPVIEEIIRLVQNQIKETSRTVKAILLVGGFGQNVYLRARLQEAVGHGINVRESLQP